MKTMLVGLRNCAHLYVEINIKKSFAKTGPEKLDALCV